MKRKHLKVTLLLVGLFLTPSANAIQALGKLKVVPPEQRLEAGYSVPQGPAFQLLTPTDKPKPKEALDSDPQLSDPSAE